MQKKTCTISIPTGICYCYKLIQGFRVTCLLTGQYTTKENGTITDVIYSDIGSEFAVRIR